LNTVTDRPYPEKKAQQGPVGAFGFEAVFPLARLLMHPAALMRISGFEICFMMTARRLLSAMVCLTYFLQNLNGDETAVLALQNKKTPELPIRMPW
jgi:hypothetical protein